MKRNKILVIAIAFLLSLALGVNTFAINDDGSGYYSNEPLGFYHANHYETGITLVRSLNPEFDGSVMEVEVITSGDVYEKYSKLFEGDIILYDISVTKNGKELNIIDGDSYVELIFPDEEVTSEKTADIYHVNDDEMITKLPTSREWQMVANTARITSFGLFIRAEGKIIDDTNLIPFSPIPTFTPQPTDTPEPSFVLPPSGDMNVDYLVDAEDALLVLKCAAKLETLTGYYIQQGDINDDNILDAEDALEILKYAAKLSNKL